MLLVKVLGEVDMFGKIKAWYEAFMQRAIALSKR